MKNTERLIISFNGQEGSGKSTIAAMVSEKLGIPRYYMGQVFREMAKERGLDLAEFRKICDIDPEFDKKIDDYVVKLSKEHNRFVIESRTAWHFIPDSIKIFLKSDSNVAAQRIFRALSAQQSRKSEDSNFGTIDEIKRSLETRRKEDSVRYFALYGICQDNESNYDFVIDTTNMSIEQVLSTVMNFINDKYNG